MVFGHRIIWLWICLVFADCTIVGQTIYETYSAHHHIKVDDIKGHRFLRFDGSLETRMNVRRPLLGHFEYTEFFQIPLLWNPKPKNVLMIGLGGGSTQRAYQAYYPDVHVDTVELDSAVIGVAKLYFGVNATRSHKIHQGDGRLFLRRNKQKKYDTIILDAYTSNRYGSYIPYHLATREFFKLAAEDITPNGILAYNVIGNYQGERSDIVGSIYRTLRTVFPQVIPIQARESKNIVLLATKKPKPMDRQSLRGYFERLKQARPRLSPNFGKHLLQVRASPPRSALISPVLTDKYASTSSLLVQTNR